MATFSYVVWEPVSVEEVQDDVVLVRLQAFVENASALAAIEAGSG